MVEIVRLLFTLMTLFGLPNNLHQAAIVEQHINAPVRVYVEAPTVYVQTVPTPEPTSIPEVSAAIVDPPVVTPVYDVPALIAQYPWPIDQAMNIARCESGFDPNVYNPSGASGVFQIMMPTHAWRFHGESPFNAVANVRVAYEIWSESGWSQWVCSPWG